LNSEDHKAKLTKHNRDASLYRPDLVHQALLAVLDSPLNKAGLVQVYLRTIRNVAIEVNPSVRIPRTFKRFCGLMSFVFELKCGFFMFF
jgi:rRNA small subunit pseudouridine methyltransferase Nep1